MTLPCAPPLLLLMLNHFHFSRLLIGQCILIIRTLGLACAQHHLTACIHGCMWMKFSQNVSGVYLTRPENVGLSSTYNMFLII